MIKVDFDGLAIRRFKYFACLVLAVYFVLLSSFLVYSWNREIEHGTQALSTTLNFGTNFCENYFVRIREQLRQLGVDLIQYGKELNYEKTVAVLDDYKRRNPDQLEYIVYHSNGKILARSSALPNETDTTFFPETQLHWPSAYPKCDKCVVFEPDKYDGTIAKLEFPLSFAVLDGHDDVRFYVRSRVQMGLLQDFWRSSALPDTSTLGFVHDDGYMVSQYSAYPRAEADRQMGDTIAKTLASHLLQPGFHTDGRLEIQRPEGVSDQLIVYRHFVGSPISLFASVPMSYVQTNWWNSVKIHLSLFLVLLAVGAVCYRLLIRQMKEKNKLALKHALLRDVTRGVLVAQEQERKRISRDLHDEVGQSLTAVKFTLNLLQNCVSESDNARTLLNNGQQMVDGLMNFIRGMAYRLRPLELDHLGLAAALKSYVDNIIHPLFPNVILANDIGSMRFPSDLELCCFRVTQEALTNCLRHAQAKNIHLSINFDPSKLILSIKDDGIGFDALRYFSPHSSPKSLGIAGMRERVEAFGGQFKVVTSPGTGTEVICTFDVEPVV